MTFIYAVRLSLYIYVATTRHQLQQTPYDTFFSRSINHTIISRAQNSRNVLICTNHMHAEAALTVPSIVYCYNGVLHKDEGPGIPVYCTCQKLHCTTNASMLTYFNHAKFQVTCVVCMCYLYLKVQTFALTNIVRELS